MLGKVFNEKSKTSNYRSFLLNLESLKNLASDFQFKVKWRHQKKVKSWLPSLHISPFIFYPWTTPSFFVPQITKWFTAFFNFFFLFLSAQEENPPSFHPRSVSLIWKEKCFFPLVVFSLQCDFQDENRKGFLVLLSSRVKRSTLMFNVAQV